MRTGERVFSSAVRLEWSPFATSDRRELVAGRPACLLISVAASSAAKTNNDARHSLQDDHDDHDGGMTHNEQRSRRGIRCPRWRICSWGQSVLLVFESGIPKLALQCS